MLGVVGRRLPNIVRSRVFVPAYDVFDAITFFYMMHDAIDCVLFQCISVISLFLAIPCPMLVDLLAQHWSSHLSSCCPRLMSLLPLELLLPTP